MFLYEAVLVWFISLVKHNNELKAADWAKLFPPSLTDLVVIAGGWRCRTTVHLISRLSLQCDEMLKILLKHQTYLYLWLMEKIFWGKIENEKTFKDAQIRKGFQMLVILYLWGHLLPLCIPSPPNLNHHI